MSASLVTDPHELCQLGVITPEELAKRLIPRRRKRSRPAA